jgi:hypothetical protein
MSGTTVFEKIANIYLEKLKSVSEFKICKTGREPHELFSEQFEGQFSKYEVLGYSTVKFVASEFENYLYQRFNSMENFICESEVEDDKEPEKPEKYMVLVVYNEK